MSEEKNQEEKTEAPRKVVKVSELIGKQADQASLALHSCCQDIDSRVAAQIQNNQELYTTLSRSLLELHNDIRGFRQKLEALEKGLFSIQQGINRALNDVTTRINDVDGRLVKLTELWNQAVKKTEEQNAANKEREEDKKSNGEDLREEER